MKASCRPKADVSGRRREEKKRRQGRFALVDESGRKEKGKEEKKREAKQRAVKRPNCVTGAALGARKCSERPLRASCVPVKLFGWGEVWGSGRMARGTPASTSDAMPKSFMSQPKPGTKKPKD